jgi:N-acetylmuramoyl-L-alanine amidase
MKTIYILTILTLLTVVAYASKTPGYTAVDKSKKFTLVIDAGHGGHDAGAIGAVTKEKIINLNVALAFGRLVERNCKDVKVIYTRKTDVFVPLHTRADIANKAKADLFISIHTNALPKKHISRGLETYTLGMHRAADNLDVAKRENSVILIEDDYKMRYQGFDPNSSESYIMFEFIQDRNMVQSVELAKLVQSRTCATAGRQNKGVKQAGFLVLRETSMPSCLIELGFISTPDEEQFLNSQSGVEKLGRGIYQAFVDYYKSKKTGGKVVEMKQEEPVKEPEPVQVKEPEPVKVKEPVKVAEPVKAKEPEPVAELPKKDSVVAVASPAPAPVVAETSDAPVFKLQILASPTKLKSSDPQLKRQKQIECYKEDGLYKYTLGSSENYNEIYQLRKAQLSNFPQAFIIAFKNGKKMNVQEAIREFKSKKVKR